MSDTDPMTNHPQTPHGIKQIAYQLDNSVWLGCEECDIAWPAGPDLTEVRPGYWESEFYR